MGLLFNEIISAILQLLAFTFIPFLFFLFRKNREESFFRYIGFYKASLNSVILILAAALLMVTAGILMAFISSSFRDALFSPHSVTGKLHLMGLTPLSIIILLITSIIKTSLSEEILFRGFIAKRLIKKFGFIPGNLAQSIIFGSVHLIMFHFIARSDAYALAFIFVFSSAAAYLIGIIKEKYAGGSIIPGWIAHGLGNTLSYFIVAFVI